MNRRTPLVIAILGLACSTTSPPSSTSRWEAELRAGQELSNGGQYVGAEQHFLKALAIARGGQTDAWLLPTSLYYLGDLYFTYPILPNSADALPLLEESLADWEALLGQQHPINAVVLDRLGSIAFDHGDQDRAQELFARADAIVEANFPPDHPFRQSRERGVRMEWALHPDEFLALAGWTGAPSK